MRKGGSAHDDRDARDQSLLDSRDYSTLLAGYYEVIRARCAIRLRSPDDSIEAAHEVIVRLGEELKRGKPYSVPFRVVVWKVTDWILQGWPAVPDWVSLPDGWDRAGPDPYAEWESEHYLKGVFEELPKREREVCELLYVDSVPPSQIAERLEIPRNAVDQALDRGRKKLREKWPEELRA